MPEDRYSVFDPGFRVARERRPDAGPVAGKTLPASAPARAGTSLALGHLRGIVIVVVVAFHSALAYLGWLTPSAAAFDQPPFQWRAFPIIDSHRWFGFDIFCAWQDVYLMALMFFLSALFTWSSLTRKGGGRFLADRFLRLGLPFLFAVAVVVPIAEYPAYRTTAIDPGVIAYVRQYLALPFWPNGPEWFLWQLLALTVVAAALHQFAPTFVDRLARASAAAASRPARFFGALTIAAVLAYAPLALAFTPFAWGEHGPFGLQFSRPLLYAVFYLAGLGVGASGIERGLLAIDGKLARDWLVWLAVALASFVVWMGLMALSMTGRGTAPFALNLAVDVSFAVACGGGCFAVLAACLRFARKPSPLLDGLANNAFAIYLLHYAFVVWLQYALLGVALFAFAKGMIVLTASLVLAWIAAAALRLVPLGARLIGEGGPATLRLKLPAARQPNVVGP